MNKQLSMAVAENAGKIIAAGETATPDTGATFGWVMPLFGDADISAHAGSGIDSIPATMTLSQDVDYPFRFSSVTLDAGSAGSLFCAHAPAR